ncbi:GNAT family N-acetyltransferase [Phenylobacterium sp.]|uniref:GNAT family N-acetyltransferase n=1 Tax=Phenylobacterium sp. TaxID=1871053 RepID=UPI002F405348
MADDVRLRRAQDGDFASIVALTNKAYRETGPGQSWSVEDLIEGPRLTDETLREDLAAAPDAQLMIWRDGADEHLGHVWLEPQGDGAWFLGLLAVRPDLQDRKLGRRLLAAAEAHAQAEGATRIAITVLAQRETLVAWYERRGYRRTGVTKPWPYHESRLGAPTRSDLYFVVLERAI